MRPSFFAIFAICVAAAWATRRALVIRPSAWLVAGLALFAAMAAYENGEMVVKGLLRTPERLDIVSLGYGIASGLLVCGLVPAELKWQRPIPRWLEQIGDASYVLHLLHFPIISACCKMLSLFGRSFAWVCFSFALTLVVCCVVSVAFYRRIELPILEFLRARLPSTAPRPVSSG